MKDTAGDTLVQGSLSSGYGPDRSQQGILVRTFEEEPSGPGFERGQDIIIDVEGGQDEHVHVQVGVGDERP